MKKTLSLLTLVTALTTFSAFADSSNDGPLSVSNNVPQFVKVTIYDGDQIKDETCMMPAWNMGFGGYQSSHDYQIKAEVKEDRGCDGRTSKEMYLNFKPNDGRPTQINIDYNNINIRY